MRDDSRIAQTITGKEGRIEKPLQSVDSIKGKNQKKDIIIIIYYFMIGLMTGAQQQIDNRLHASK